MHQPRRGFNRWPYRPIVSPGAHVAVTGGGEHDNVGPDLSQVLVFHLEVVHHTGGEVLTEDITDGHQGPEEALAPVSAQVYRDSQLVSVLVVEVGAPVPELVAWGVFVENRVPVGVQPCTRLKPDNLRTHVHEQLTEVGDSQELAHLDDSYTLKR